VFCQCMKKFISSLQGQQACAKITSIASSPALWLLFFRKEITLDNLFLQNSLGLLVLLLLCSKYLQMDLLFLPESFTENWKSFTIS